MTVAELIAELQKHDPSLPVIMRFGEVARDVSEVTFVGVSVTVGVLHELSSVDNPKAVMLD